MSTTSNSDEAVFTGDMRIVMNKAKSVLGCLSEITASIGSAKLENYNVHEIGSYFYRVSLALKELANNKSDSVTEILQSLSESEELAKDVLGRLQQSGHNVSDYDLKTLINQLEGIINHMGEHLNLIPISAFSDQKYAETAICSLSEEMRKCKFDAVQVAVSTLNHPEVESISAESDLYSVSTVACTDNSHASEALQEEGALRTTRQRSQKLNTKLSSTSIGAQHVEPIYESFICPLTKNIMEDPVTIQSGVTYERNAITEYFEEFEEPICPITGEKVQSKAMSSNIALRNIIQEWKDRNDIAQLNVIRAAFSTGSTDDMILEALKDLKSIWQRNAKSRKEVFNIGIIPMIVRLLELRDRNVRSTAIEMMQLLATQNEGKELIGKTPAIASTIRQLSSSFKPIRHSALLLLIELSKSESLSEKIGYVRGGILILIQTKYNRSVDPFASEAADQVLRNLEQCPNNIKLMAENGYIEPLLNNLIEGSQSRKLQMVTYLGEIILEEDRKSYVVEQTAAVLVQMLHNGDSLQRKSVFKAFAQTSSNPASGRTLVEAGIVRIIINEIFTKRMISESADSLKEASAVLVNILESGVDLESLVVNGQGHTMASKYVVFNITCMIKNSKADELKLNLIRILYQIAKSTKSAFPVVSAVKESEASYTLVELLNNPSDEMAIVAIKLLTVLSSQMGHLLIERLCMTNGQPDGLVQIQLDPGQITERQARSVCFLAKLPHDNITLNLALVSKNAVPRILESIFEFRREIRQDGYSRMYLEGLVGILVRFTATLYDPQILFLAINYNFTAEFTDLLTETSVEEVQRLAAKGLEKLSAQSINLSKPPQLMRNKSARLYLPRILTCGASRHIPTRLCIAHKGVCSEQDTFCLIEANAVEKLLLCLENKNVKVVEAVLSALSTLVDDKVDTDESVKLLIEMSGIEQILKALKCHKNQSLWHKGLWVLERFLMKGGKRSLFLLSQDRLFNASVVTAFHHGNTDTKQIAEKILRHLEQMPSFPGTFTM